MASYKAGSSGDQRRGGRLKTHLRQNAQDAEVTLGLHGRARQQRGS